MHHTCLTKTQNSRWVSDWSQVLQLHGHRPRLEPSPDSPYSALTLHHADFWVLFLLPCLLAILNIFFIDISFPTVSKIYIRNCENKTMASWNIFKGIPPDFPTPFQLPLSHNFFSCNSLGQVFEVGHVTYLPILF